MKSIYLLMVETIPIKHPRELLKTEEFKKAYEEWRKVKKKENKKKDKRERMVTRVGNFMGTKEFRSMLLKWKQRQYTNALLALEQMTEEEREKMSWRFLRAKEEVENAYNEIEDELNQQ